MLDLGNRLLTTTTIEDAQASARGSIVVVGVVGGVGGVVVVWITLIQRCQGALAGRLRPERASGCEI